MATRKKIEADSKGKLEFSSQLDKMAPVVPGPKHEKAPETADDPVPAQTEGDTDIGKKIQDVIEHEYPRTRVGTDGYLHAILCELIRARLSK